MKSLENSKRGAVGGRPEQDQNRQEHEGSAELARLYQTQHELASLAQNLDAETIAVTNAEDTI